MPATPHVEHHFMATETVRDVVIGMSDGLTVPFALAAGLSGAVQVTAVIVTAGLAEIAAGSIAMGLGGYLAARTDAEHYESERQREITETEEVPEVEAEEVADVFRGYGLKEDQIAPVVAAMRADRDRWVDFMMALIVFGYVKARLTGVNPLRGALQTALTGGLAATAAFIIARLIG
jgi:VIT1/CCC1 family predicted Fe2+/Mn2+ transporter